MDKHNTNLIKQFNRSQQPQKTLNRLNKDKKERSRAESYKKMSSSGMQSPLIKNKKCLLFESLGNKNKPKVQNLDDLGKTELMRSKTSEIKYSNSLNKIFNGRVSFQDKNTLAKIKQEEKNLETILENQKDLEMNTPYFSSFRMRSA